MESNQITEACDNFSSESFIDTIETCVNNFSFNAEKSAQDLVEMSPEKQKMLLDAVDSCIYSLAHTDRIDGRNEIAAEVSRRLNPLEDPMPDVGGGFLRMHPTLQQSAMKLLCCYLDKAEVPEYQEAIGNLKEERGDFWYRFPLI